MYKLFSLKNVLLLVLVVGSVLLFAFSGVHAAQPDPCETTLAVDSAGKPIPCTIVNPLGKTDTIPKLICVFIGLLVSKLMPPIMVLMVLWASFLLLTSLGQPAKLVQARSMLVYAIVGAVILIMAAPLVSLVGSALGGGVTDQSCNPATATATAIGVLVNIINWFSWMLAILSVAMGLYAGFLYMTAAGEPQKVSTANNVLVYTVIGVVVAILAFSIKAIIDIFIVT
ncbi:MAG: pilin [Candidatus Azambacteria bacterium]|nr:pilin [Candidatus Azambacteria bacterium]